MDSSNAHTPEPQDPLVSTEHNRQLPDVERSPVSAEPDPTVDKKASDGPDGTSSLKKGNAVTRLASLWERMTESKEEEPTTQWHTTWNRLLPLLGLGCILLAIGSIFADLVVLLTSDNKQANWKYQPATSLAIFTAIANQSMRFASLQGVAITWWSGALHEKGISLAALHYNWDMGTIIWGALTAGKRTNLLALACLISTLVAVDGPLLQQSSKVVSMPIPEDEGTAVTLTFELSPELPSYYTGIVNFTALPGWLSSDGDARATQTYVQGPYRDQVLNSTIYGQVSGCSGSCRATIKAPAFSIKSCKNISLPVHYHSNKADKWPVSGATWYPSVPPLYNGPFKTDFYTDVSWTMDDKEHLNVTAFSAVIDNLPNCSGIANDTSCILESAIGEYDIIVTNTTDVKDLSSLMNSTIQLHESVAYVPIVTLANNTLSTEFAAKSDVPYAALMGFAVSDLTGLVRHFWRDEANTSTIEPIFSDQRLNLRHSQAGLDVQYRCSRYTDPFEDLLDSLNRLAFRTGARSVQDFERGSGTALGGFAGLLDPGQSTQQTVSGYKTGSWNAYETNFAWFYGATAAEVLCILLILPTFWGWWKIGRAVSFSPLEIAKAFDAPLLAACNSNLAAEDLAKATEERLVRYGAAGALDGESLQPLLAEKLTFADKEDVYRPLDTFDFEK